MWLYLTFLLIIGAVIADHQYAWETGNEYHFRIESRTLTVLDKLAKEYSGIFIKGHFTVQVISSDTLQAVVSETQYASMNITLSNIWDKITDLEFQELSLSRKSFEIKLKNGVIQDVLVDQDVPTWEVNLLKSIVSQLQIDIQRENVIASTSTEMPNDNQPFGTFKVMEDSVGGKCEVLYNITSVSEYFPSVSLPHRKDNLTFAITKTKNYTKCEQQMAYHSGITGKMNWKSKSNDNLLSRSSTTRIIISGNFERFTILSSMMTSQIFINSQIHDTYSSAVYSGINLILEARMSEISNPMPISNNLVSTGNLMYINHPFSSQPKPEPKLDEAPENLLLPYFIGYKGKSIQESGENYALVAAYLIGQITGEIEYFPIELLKHPFNETSERFITLVRLIRTMNVEQIAEIENKLPELFYQDNRSEFASDENQKSYNQTVWDVLCHAVAHAGTGPALITIKNWIKNEKLKGIQAAHIISKIPKSALAPTAEYVTAFFELITDEQVTKQKFLNTTAPLSFAELVRYIQNNKSSIYYPVYRFGRTASKHNNALLETYIPYMATQLREAIKEGDSRRIQTYIMALGNFGHTKILSVFEPYLEGTLPASKFQRLMMVLSLSKLSESFPRIARSVAYKIYMNVMEAYELRCAAVFIIMKTNPSLAMLQRMAEFTNQDQDQHVNFVIMLNLDTLANLKEPEWKELAGKARNASKLLNPDIYEKNYFQSIIEKINNTFLNYAQTSILQIIDSDDINVPKGGYIDIHSSIGFNLPPSKITYTISSIRNLLDVWYQMPWMIEDVAEKKLIIEEIVEKLGIKPKDAEQLEGNIFTDTMFALEFYPFDNNTIEEVINMFNTYVTLMSETSTQFFESRNMNLLNHYDMMMGFSTETGLPFIYTLTMSALRRISCGGSYKVMNSQTERFMELTVAGHEILNDKIQSRIGFITPFEHRHYIAGIDTNIQIFIPAGLSIKSEGKKKFELKILPHEYYRAYGTNHIAIHYSVVPYIAKHDILDFEPVVLSSDTRLVHIEEPHEIKLSLGNLTFAARSDCIDSEMSKITRIEAFKNIYDALNKYDGAYYRRFDAILHLTSIAQVNITFDTFKVFINESSEATIPATFDKKPESDARKVQFLHEVNKDINSAISQIIDMSILVDNKYHVFTFASANSRVDNKFQVLFHWNVQHPSGKIFCEFCTVGYTRSSRIPLNFEKAIEKIPYYEFKAEMRVGSCASGEPIRFKGNWTRTDDAVKIAMKSGIVEECRQEIKQGNIWIPVCQRARKLVQHKDLLMMSTNMVSDYFLALVNGIFSNKVMIFKKESISNIDNNTLEIKMPLDSYNANISLLISHMDFIFSVEDTIDVTLLKKYLDNSEEATKKTCVLDKTQVVTFDNKVYPVNLGKCWHVMMTTYPKRDSNNPENTLNIPKNRRVVVMAREMDDGNKQIQMILDDQKIHLQKSSDRLEATVNDQIANFSHHESYQGDAFEIYELDEMIAISSQQYDIYAVYDGERIILYLPLYKYLNAIRGLCGNFDKQSSNDFISPKNCILTKPEEFIATYALTQEECQGPALQNKRKAEQSTCIFKSYHLTDVISDREAGRSSTRRPRYH